MTKEVKLGLAVILSLLVVLGVVLVRRMNSTDPLRTTRVASNRTATGKPLGPKLSGGPKPPPTLLEPKTGSAPVPSSHSSLSSRNRWQQTGKSKEDDRSDPRTSFMPKSPATSASDRYSAKFHASGSSSDAQKQNDYRFGATGDFAPSDRGRYSSPGGRDLGDDDDDIARLRNFGATDSNGRGSADLDYREYRDGAGVQRNRFYDDSASATGQGRHAPPPADSPYQRRLDGLQQTQSSRTGQYYGGGQSYRVMPGDGSQMPTKTISDLDNSTATLRENTGKYYVEPGDSFWTIAQKIYGDGGYFKALQEHNRVRFPRPGDLQVGDIVSTPDTAALRERFSDICPKERKAKPGAPRIATVATANLRGGRTYVVEDGDTLFDIARYELGESKRWPEIYQLNRDALGEDMDYLRPGTKLTLPATARPDRVTQEPGTIRR